MDKVKNFIIAFLFATTIAAFFVGKSKAPPVPDTVSTSTAASSDSTSAKDTSEKSLKAKGGVNLSISDCNNSGLNLNLQADEIDLVDKKIAEFMSARNQYVQNTVATYSTPVGGWKIGLTKYKDDSAVYGSAGGLYHFGDNYFGMADADVKIEKTIPLVSRYGLSIIKVY